MDELEKRARDWFSDEGQRDQVRGYLQRTQARALLAILEQQARAGVTGALAEIGVFLGKTLIGMARAARPGEPVVGVDPLVIGQQDLLPELTRNVQAHLNADELARLSIKRVLSTQLDALQWMESLRQPARFVHLDGHHARETILHDLQLASAWLQKGAVVVIDDFLNELHPDLTSGIIDGLAAHPQLEPVAVIPRMGHIEEGGSKLVCATRGHAGMYREALDRALADHLRPWADRMLGAEVRVYRSSLPQKPAVQPSPPSAAARPLPVVFALQDKDGSYWLNTAVAAASAAQYATRPISIHVLHDGSLPEIARQRLTRICEKARVPLSLTPVQLPAGVDVERLRQFGAASVFRLLIPRLFAGEEQVIYLDSDLVVNGLDVAELAAAAPPGAPISAVRDPFIARAASHAKELDRLGLDPRAYFNSGVLVLRPGLLQQDLLEAFAQFSAANPTSIHPDQDFLNTRFAGQVGVLDERFNFQVGLHEQRLLRPLSEYAGKILHYAGKIKPLQGNLAPGLLPFWIHAQAVPELTQGLAADPRTYLLPLAENPDGLQLQGIGSPGAQAKAESAEAAAPR
jgi:lipopolysaccharide biosynthesis glycosyltransferase/predicted O-methyltransferase YrrM